MKAEIKLVTPEIAKELLANNKINRRLRRKHVLHLAELMQRGKWKLNGQTIIITTDGQLLDGQHRLEAVLKSGTAITSFIISGVDVDVLDTIDTGKSRNASDVFDILQIPNSRSIAGGINKYLMLSKGYSNTMISSTDSRISSIDIKEEYLLNEILYQNLFRNASHFYKSNFRILSVSEYIGFYRLFQIKHSTSVVDAFFSAIENRIDVGRVLYERLMKNTISKKETLTTSEKNAIIIKAFNAYNSGKVLKMLKFSVEEPFPKVA